MRNLVNGLFLLSFAIAGCGELELEVGQTEQAIVNGSLDTAHATVGVLHSGGISACTATLIGPRTVLTAAHCVARETAPYEKLSPVNYFPEGFNGPKIPASAVFVHPDYAGGNRADIAIVQLSSPVATAPAKLSAKAPTLGEAVDVVGYGKTGEGIGEFGIRRHASNAIGKVEPQLFRVYGSSGDIGNVCNGDSGGPTFANRDGQEVVIGVHSTKGGLCGDEGIDIRVDVFLAWIADSSNGDVIVDRLPASAPTPADPGSKTAQTDEAAGGFIPETADAIEPDAVEGGCSVAGSSSTGTLSGLLLVLGLALAIRRRAR